MTGFDSSLTKCPKCNSIHRPRVNRVNWSFIHLFLIFLFSGISLPILASILDRVFDPESIVYVVFVLFTAHYFGIIFWSYADANQRRKSGCLVALLVTFMPIMGLILWLIFRPALN